MDQETELVVAKTLAALLAQAIYEMSVSAGWCKGEVSLTGPEVLLLASDLSTELRRLAAVEAELVALRELEPVAWQSKLLPYHDWLGCTKEFYALRHRREPHFIATDFRALYARPVPQTQETLDKPARVRGVVFGPGVKVMTVIQAAQRCAEEYVPEDAPGIKQEILRGLANSSQLSGWQPLKTSQKGRDAVAAFFVDKLHRHDFTRYINNTLAADFACVLGGYLSSNHIAPQDSPVIDGHEWPEDRGEHPQRGLGVR